MPSRRTRNSWLMFIAAATTFLSAAVVTAGVFAG
jgi:hypothetical protein